MNKFDIKRDTIIIRGAGDLATGVAYSLFNAGFRMLLVETDMPMAIRRSVSFCEAVYSGSQIVENITCRLAESYSEAEKIIDIERIALIVDSSLSFLQDIPKPKILIDAIIAKRNIGTKITMADFVIALGPGFIAGEDCDLVIETMRGHNLGRLIYNGSALANTGVPGLIAGHDEDRVIHAPISGEIKLLKNIGDMVRLGENLALITDLDTGKNEYIYATISGVLRGIIREKFFVNAGMKIADIDPRVSERDNCFTISDKSRSIGNACLLGVMKYISKNFCY